MAALIASWNCCSLIASTGLALGSFEPSIASRVSFKPSASAGTLSDGSVIEKAATAFATDSSIALPFRPATASIDVSSPS
jgi:hypothetical protein